MNFIKRFVNQALQTMNFIKTVGKKNLFQISKNKGDWTAWKERHPHKESDIVLKPWNNFNYLKLKP